MKFTFLLVCALGALFFVILAEHPLRMGFGLALYSLASALMMGEDYSRYFGYVMYFIYVGTLMVMFCMVVRLAPNPVFRVTPLVTLYLFQTGGRVVEDLFVEDVGIKYSGGAEVWGDSEKIEEFRSIRDLRVELMGDVYEGLGVYDGAGWGSILIWLGLVLMLRVVCVANICKRFDGPLVRFVAKGEE